MTELDSHVESILIVDDEPLNRKLLTGHLERWGYRTLSASSGQQALEMVAANPDLILLDIMMPGLDGFETCRLLKEQEAYSDIPIIFLSALDDAEHKTRGLEVGGVDYIGKPFFSKELQARVRTHLTLRRQERKLRQYNDALEDMVRERSSRLKTAEKELLRDFDIQTTLNKLLRNSLSGEPLASHMSRALDMIMEVSWFPSLGRGCIFVTTDNGLLEMMASRNLDQETRDSCSIVDPGSCVCGSCATDKKIIVADGPDLRDGPEQASSLHSEHKHLCAPILKGDTLLGLVNLYIQPDYSPDEKDLDFVGSVTNTLAQIILYCQALDRLVASEEQYRSVFESTGTAMAILNPDHSFSLANTRFQKLFQLQGSEEAGDCLGSMLTHIHPDDRERFLSIHPDRELAPRGAAGAQDVQISHEIRLLDAHSHLIDVVLTMSSIPGDDRVIISLVDITDRKNAERQLMYHAFHDSLTGLPNRSMFLDHVNARIFNAARMDAPFAVLIMDLDRFAIINESLGHNLGDKLLVAVAGRLGSFMGDSCFVARLGGDEFALFLDNADPSQARELAWDILELFKEPFALEGNEFFSTASIGITTSEAEYLRGEDMLRDADTALNRAKLEGKARFACFDHQMHVNATQVMTIINDMRFALERNEFFLLYQPIVRLDTGRPVGVEALVRWKHTKRGVIPPDKFIPLAEETGFIKQLGSWVLSQACTAMNGFQSSAPATEPLSVSVNLSVHQFDQEGFFEEFKHIIHDSGLPSKLLKLEITESAIMQDADRAISILRHLKELDVSILVDDFGTGYSSLSYLHRLPLDTLKIDRSFVSRMDDSEEHVETVRTIINLARNLGLNLIAEGVENESQRRMLLELGCDLAQGYLFSPPAPLEDLIGNAALWR